MKKRLPERRGGAGESLRDPERRKPQAIKVGRGFITLLKEKNSGFRESSAGKGSFNRQKGIPGQEEEPPSPRQGEKKKFCIVICERARAFHLEALP